MTPYWFRNHEGSLYCVYLQPANAPVISPCLTLHLRADTIPLRLRWAAYLFAKGLSP